MNSATNDPFDSAGDDQCREKFVRDLRSSLQYAVIQITAAADRNNGTKMSSRAIQALSELTFQYATTCLPNDLKAFSDHANRKKTINVEDVQLVVRKNPAISQQLADFCEDSGNDNTVGTIGAAFTAAATNYGKTTAAASTTGANITTSVSTVKRKTSIMNSLYYRAPATTSSSSSSSGDDHKDKNKDKNPTSNKKKSTATSHPSWHTAAFRKRNDSSDDSSSDDSEIQILSSPPKKQSKIAVFKNYESESDEDSPPRRREEPYKSQAMQIIANMSPNTPPSPTDAGRNKRKKKKQRKIPPVNLDDSDEKEEVKKKHNRGDLLDTDSEEVEWDSPEKGNEKQDSTVKGGASKRKVIEDDDTESEGY